MISCNFVIICSKQGGLSMLTRKFCKIKTFQLYNDRLRFFQLVVSSAANFGNPHRTIRRSDLQTMKVECRKLIRQIVSAPGHLDWSAPWHETLHEWNLRARFCMGAARVKCGSRVWCEQYWRFPTYVANLPSEPWFVRALNIALQGHRNVGRPRHTWEEQLYAYSPFANFGSWRQAALDLLF